jgi:hypothetical protein
LYGYLAENDSILSLDFFNRDYLHIFSRDVLDKIRDGDPEWETMVPPEVVHLIKERGYFGYRAPGQPQDEAHLNGAPKEHSVHNVDASI